MNEPQKPLGDIEVGFSVDQADAIVMEFDALYAHSNHDGKRKVKELFKLRDTLAAELERTT